MLLHPLLARSLQLPLLLSLLNPLQHSLLVFLFFPFKGHLLTFDLTQFLSLVLFELRFNFERKTTELAQAFVGFQADSLLDPFVVQNALCGCLLRVACARHEGACQAGIFYVENAAAGLLQVRVLGR